MRQAPIFKGATRPACIWGVPIIPFVLVTGALTMFSFIVYVPLAITIVPVILIMKQITKDDDQRFLQLWLYFRVNVLGCGNKGRFGKIGSLSPVTYKRFRGTIFKKDENNNE